MMIDTEPLPWWQFWKPRHPPGGADLRDNLETAIRRHLDWPESENKAGDIADDVMAVLRAASRFYDEITNPPCTCTPEKECWECYDARQY